MILGIDLCYIANHRKMYNKLTYDIRNLPHCVIIGGDVCSALFEFCNLEFYANNENLR